ncbi:MULTISPECIES: selenium-binding family protein [unclassified Rhizobium]|nr:MULTISPECIES: selenium-binding family protein [unclassified Rhizobium]MCS3743507.1 hypothetical protein [Rhizobium sp. BK661]
MDPGPERLSYDVWRHPGHDTLVTSDIDRCDRHRRGLIAANVAEWRPH